MNDAPRKKSPRAPSIPLEDAIERASKIYEKERRHAAPTDIVAQNIGYKSANNGAALQMLASLRYYGLLERPQEGQLAVTKEVEAYVYAPTGQMREDLLMRWLQTPQVFSDLLEKYHDGLPSDATLRYDLIQKGFNPVSAENVISVFKQSVEFVRYFDIVKRQSEASTPTNQPSVIELDNQESPERISDIPDVLRAEYQSATNEAKNLDLDRIPIRLTGGRRAWLLIPTPFFNADKKRLKAQIDLLLTEDDIEESE